MLRWGDVRFLGVVMKRGCADVLPGTGLRLFVFLVIFLFSTGAMSQGCVFYTYHGHHYDEGGVINGDVERLKQQVSHSSGRLRLAYEAALARVMGDINGSDVYAQQCLAPAGEEALSDELRITCGRLMAGNAFLRGDLAQWAEGLRQISGILQASISGTGRKHIRINDVDISPDLAVFEKVPSAFAVTDTSPRRLDFKAGMNGLPVLALGIGDRGLDAMVDTGSSTSSLGKAQALHPIEYLGTLGCNDNTGRLRPEKIYLSDASIGNIFIKHQVFYETPAPIGLIGVDILRKLGSVVLARDHLELLDPDDPRLRSCHQPMYSQSSLGGQFFKLLMPIKVDGHAEMALLDTGNNTLLSERVDVVQGYEGKGWQQADRLIVYGLEKVWQRNRPVYFMLEDVDQGQVTLVQEMDTRFSELPRYSIGAPILKKSDLLLDFEHGHMCLLPAGHAQ